GLPGPSSCFPASAGPGASARRSDLSSWRCPGSMISNEEWDYTLVVSGRSAAGRAHRVRHHTGGEALGQHADQFVLLDRLFGGLLAAAAFGLVDGVGGIVARCAVFDFQPQDAAEIFRQDRAQPAVAAAVGVGDRK